MLFNTKRVGRLVWISLILTVATVTVYAAINVFEKNLVFFYSPSQILNGDAPTNKSIRLGGMVQMDSIKRENNSLDISFNVIDEKNNIITVKYSGVVPDLFKEGKGVVAQGILRDGVFLSSEILAKHDENYMPPDLNLSKTIK